MKQKKPPKTSFGIGKNITNVESSGSWTIAVLIMSFVFSISFSGITTTMLSELNLMWAFVVLMFIIFINILFDIIGTATQAAQEMPFHSLSARKVAGAAESVNILRHAPQVSNLCNDVIGDIAGIISGGATATIVTELVMTFSLDGLWPSFLLTGLVSSLTIGGKAFCKSLAIKNANYIVFLFGKVIYYLTYPFSKLKKR